MSELSGNGKLIKSPAKWTLNPEMTHVMLILNSSLHPTDYVLPYVLRDADRLRSKFPWRYMLLCWYSLQKVKGFFALFSVRHISYI